MKKLIFDTNFLVYYSNQKLFNEIEYLLKTYLCFILDKTLKEMEKLRKGKHKFRIELMLSFLDNAIKDNKLKLLKAKEKSVDGEIIRLIT